MLKLINSLIDKPVLSFRSGTAIATVQSPLINPDNLKIEGFYCKDRFHNNPLIMLYSDIRDFNGSAYFVNDIDALSEPEELVRLKKVIDAGWILDGKPVYTVSKQKVGKVNDYAVEVETMYIQKLYVSQNLLKNFKLSSLSIDRSQIQEITDKRIVIQDLVAGGQVTATVAA